MKMEKTSNMVRSVARMDTHGVAYHGKYYMLKQNDYPDNSNKPLNTYHTTVFMPNDQIFNIECPQILWNAEQILAVAWNGVLHILFNKSLNNKVQLYYMTYNDKTNRYRNVELSGIQNASFSYMLQFLTVKETGIYFLSEVYDIDKRENVLAICRLTADGKIKYQKTVTNFAGSYFKGYIYQYGHNNILRKEIVDFESFTLSKNTEIITYDAASNSNTTYPDSALILEFNDALYLYGLNSGDKQLYQFNETTNHFDVVSEYSNVYAYQFTYVFAFNNHLYGYESSSVVSLVYVYKSDTEIQCNKEAGIDPDIPYVVTCEFMKMYNAYVLKYLSKVLKTELQKGLQENEECKKISVRSCDDSGDAALISYLFQNEIKP